MARVLEGNVGRRAVAGVAAGRSRCSSGAARRVELGEEHNNLDHATTVRPTAQEPEMREHGLSRARLQPTKNWCRRLQPSGSGVVMVHVGKTGGGSLAQYFLSPRFRSCTAEFLSLIHI